MRKSRAGVDIRHAEAGKKNEYIIRGMSVRVRAAALVIVLIAAAATAACGSGSSASSTSTKRISDLATDGSADADRQRVDPGAGRAARPRPRHRSRGAGRSRQDPRRLRVAGDRGDPRQPAVAARRPALRAGAAQGPRHPQAGRASAPFSWSRYALRRGGRPARLPADDGRVGAAAGDAAELRLEGEGAGRDPRCTCPAGSSITTPATSTPTKAAPCSAATSWRGNSCSPIGSTAGRSRSKCGWTGSRFSTRTLWLFAGAFVAAVLLLVRRSIWLTIRKGAREAADDTDRRPAPSD